MRPLYPPSFEERNLAGDIHIEPEDIADYAYQPGQRERYSDAGWEKAKRIGVAPYSLADLNEGEP